MTAAPSTPLTTKPQPAMPDVKTLPALQKHIDEVCQYFGWQGGSNEKVFLLFAEEVGELAKAIRKAMNMDIEVGKEQTQAEVQANLNEEFADCLNYLMDLANRFNVDLEQAYVDKTEQNYRRSWASSNKA